MDDVRILVLEDEVLIALDIKAALDEAGYGEVVVCTTSEKAREAVLSRPPQIAVLDINLGRQGTSLDFAAEIAKNGCRILFLSGYAVSTISLSSELVDMPRIAKPFHEPELLAKITELLA